uniref:Pescadillo homolog n=1 Tax=Spongospora subterranea TaxID=70186 RepID=A0A0H5RAA7_9EUKA|eukprot:CRZ11085.1 hypothetical protein [Spongospora subterranea]
MGRLQKSGESGVAAQYYTRGQALRKLQVSLPDFRRLCILKGIYPRDPKKKANGRDKTYYHKKDIGFLLYEPLLAKFRDMKIFLRQHKRFMARHEEVLAESLESRRPVMSLDHLVRERYPTFLDALRDIDDALTLTHLFANIPVGLTSFHTSSIPQQCVNVSREFQSIAARERWLRKVFVSIKGIYYQANIHGETVTWIVPHKFPQQCPDNVDYKVLFTFLEFYLTLLKFVNFKLFHDAGLNYPPAVNTENQSKGQLISSIVLTKSFSDEADEQIDAEFRECTSDDANAAPPVFEGLVFLLSREVPCDALEFVVLSGGGRVIREEDEIADVDEITHQIVDRPNLLGEAISTREYIQPQWVFDSFNMGALLPVHPYGVGMSLPPHLSPFVDDAAEGYVPTQRKTLESWALGKSTMDAIAECANDIESDEPESSSEDEEDKEGEDDKSVAVEKAKPKKRSRGEVKDIGESASEEKDLAKIMMTNKNKRLYSRMQYGINEKKTANAVLDAKRRKIEKSSKKKQTQK